MRSVRPRVSSLCDQSGLKGCRRIKKWLVAADRAYIVGLVVVARVAGRKPVCQDAALELFQVHLAVGVQATGFQKGGFGGPLARFGQLLSHPWVGQASWRLIVPNPWKQTATEATKERL